MRSSQRRLGDAEHATPKDVPALNRLFSDTFTERYRRDGMVGIRVPFLNPAIWNYAISLAGEGAMVWRDDRGSVGAFNMVHLSGCEGWMGPIAVREDLQGMGIGHRIVKAGTEWLRSRHATCIGLETMPRTLENIGFYSSLGFLPRRLTITLQADSRLAEIPGIVGIAGQSVERQTTILGECTALTQSVLPGSDYRRECELTLQNKLGDLLVLERGDSVVAFALWHAVPLAQGRNSDELRILKLVAGDLSTALRLLEATRSVAAGLDLSHVSLRCQTDREELYASLVDDGWQVQWTDLRMTMSDYQEAPVQGVALSNWEI